MDWSGKVVLITGGTSGIGRALALELARRGASLGLVARRAELLSEVLIEAAEQSEDSHLIALPADVHDEKAMRAAGKRLAEECGHVDVLIANAGIGVTNPG